jgi:hypothetical protein
VFCNLKVNAFPFKNKDKSHIFHAKATFTLCGAGPCLFCFEAICDRYFFKLNCFKLIGWFNHHNVFPPTRSVCYRFLHCDNRKLHCDNRKLHCDYKKIALCLQKIALWLQKIALLFGINCTEINQSQSSNIFMYIIKTEIRTSKRKERRWQCGDDNDRLNLCFKNKELILNMLSWEKTAITVESSLLCSGRNHWLCLRVS